MESALASKIIGEALGSDYHGDFTEIVGNRSLVGDDYDWTEIVGGFPAWDGSQNYSAGSMVSYWGQNWKATRDITPPWMPFSSGDVPGNSDAWAPLSAAQSLQGIEKSWFDTVKDAATYKRYGVPTWGWILGGLVILVGGYRMMKK